jgi:hypothetical protein
MRTGGNCLYAIATLARMPVAGMKTRHSIKADQMTADQPNGIVGVVH